jgi:hypothetical protein
MLQFSGAACERWRLWARLRYSSLLHRSLSDLKAPIAAPTLLSPQPALMGLARPLRLRKDLLGSKRGDCDAYPISRIADHGSAVRSNCHDDKSADSQPARQFGHIIPQIPATSGTPTLSGSGHILPSPMFHQRAADNRYRSALPRAVVPKMQIGTPPLTRSSGFRVVRPPLSSSQAAPADKSIDLAEPVSFKDLPSGPRERLW